MSTEQNISRNGDQVLGNSEKDGSPGSSELSNTSVDVASFLSPTHEIAFIFTVCMAQGLQLAGLAQSISPLHVIGDSFGVTNPGKLSWTAAAYSLGVGTFILPAGRLGDIFGHKKLFISGILFYALWSLLAGVSVYSTFEFYAVCRGFQGVGASFMVPNALALIGRTFAVGNKKNMAFAFFGVAAPVGWLFGAVFAAIFAQLAWWPWAYWTGCLVACGLAVIATFTIPPDNLGSQDGSQLSDENSRALSIWDFDFSGAITGISALILFNFSWNQAAVVGWQTAYTYVLLIISILIFGVFMYIELQIAKDPLLPLRDLTKETAFVLVILAAGWGSFGIWTYYSWQLFEVLRGASPLLSSAYGSPVAVSGLLASICTGILLGKINVAWIMLMAMLCFLVGQILMATVPVAQTYWAQTFVSYVIMPWGMDMSFPAGIAILSMNMAHGDQGLASSLVNTVVNYSISMGLAFAGTIETHVNDGGRNILRGYRGAWWFAVGLDILGLFFSLYFVWISRRQSK